MRQNTIVFCTEVNLNSLGLQKETSLKFRLFHPSKLAHTIIYFWRPISSELTEQVVVRIPFIFEGQTAIADMI